MRGSPPLTRGIHFLSKFYNLKDRFTPAHAGNTCFLVVFTIEYKVHPRSRGEYSKNFRIFSHNTGSPPLTRGIPSHHFPCVLLPGFTPAHAGNTVVMFVEHI